MVQTQYKKSIQVWQTDNAMEFMDAKLGKVLSDYGNRHQTSCPYTPQQNGLVERKNRQLLEVVRASLFGMNVPRCYWGEAVKSVVYLINRTPSSVLDFQTPQQKLNSFIHIPHQQNLEPRVFGCVVFVHVPKPLRGKLRLCAKRCMFVGYADFQKGYRCYDPHTKQLHVSLDVSFRELEPYYPIDVPRSSLQRETLVEGKNSPSVEDRRRGHDLEEFEGAEFDERGQTLEETDGDPEQIHFPSPTPYTEKGDQNIQCDTND